MNSYTLTVWALYMALGTQAFAAGLGIECCLLRNLPRARWRTWMALTIGSLLLVLHHAYSLELVVRTSLHDPRQSILAALAGACFALASFALKRQA